MSAVVVLILRILMVIFLYGFLAWALVTIWRELRAHGRNLSAPLVPPIVLVSQQDSQAEPRTYASAEVIVGRSSKCDLCLQNETVSSRHARLSFHHNQWWIEDLQSTNGTYINDERVSVPTVVAAGDELRFGQVGMTIEIGEKSR